MNDLYVAPGVRGRGVGRSLIQACAREARAHGADRLGWQTAPDNDQAQALYESVGASREQWVDYFRPVDDPSAGDD
jgi:ribosomal protein S18 acetylase RimI-like enzyme